MGMEQAEDLLLQILKQVMEEKVDAENIELAAITVDKPYFRIYTKDQIDDIIKRVDDDKKKDDDDDEDDDE